MGLNPMESAGCFSIIKALQKNPNTKLELIDFSVNSQIILCFQSNSSLNERKFLLKEIIVDKYFRDEYKSFQALFPHIEVRTGCDGIKLRPKIRIHPVVKLRNYIEKHNIKLIDFFNKFDKDGSMTVTKVEFKEGILVIHTEK